MSLYETSNYGANVFASQESIMSRPFGVALLIAGWDEDGPALCVGSTHPHLHSEG